VTSVLEFSAVGKSFRRRRSEVRALHDVTFSIDEGEVFGFVGPNGAGKSTTIKIMLDVITDYEGAVKISGVSAREAIARKGVAYVPETPALYEQFTPLEVLRTGLDMCGVRRDDVEAYCMDWLERFSVGHAAKRRVRELSKGTVQRVALAHALAVAPRLLVLDEPLSGLDPVGRRDVVEILLDFKRQGGAIFLTSHVLHDVERIADRFGLIHKGELRAVRAPSDLVGEDERVLVRSLGTTAVAEMSAEPGGRWVAEISRPALWPLLDALKDAGHVLLEIRPALSLETAFLHVVKGGEIGKDVE
jgi:ABC-2 type transport system ATP-binding protein